MDRVVDWYARADKAISCSLVRDWPNLPIERAQGSYVYAPDGRAYLDFCAGMASCNTGHCHPTVVAAIRDQAEKLIHGPMGVLLYEPIVALAEELAKVTPPGLNQFFFLNSGSEAVEGAIKLARYVTEKPVIVAFTGAFHGRTMGATTLTSSKAKYRTHYQPLLGGVYHLPYPYCFRCPSGQRPGDCGLFCFRSVQRLFDHLADPSEIAAFIIEPVMGEGGYVPAPPEFLARLRRICDDHAILLIFDEVQTGFGRTGAMFAAQTLGVTPDIMVIAKGIASGMPLSATVASKELMSRWAVGAHGTTFGGNPLACAAALATLKVFREENVLANVRRQGSKALESLRDLPTKYPIVGDVRGLGLMIGIEFVNPADGLTPNPQAVEAVLRACLDERLIVYPCGTHGQGIRFIPPLVVSDDELASGLDILKRAIRSVAAD
jgi:4-aminobutyrate aminotransferase